MMIEKKHLDSAIDKAYKSYGHLTAIFTKDEFKAACVGFSKQVDKNLQEAERIRKRNKLS